jgi:hypothetical protein
MMSSSTASKVTTDHYEIRQWAEERGAKPAAVARTEGNNDSDFGIIRLDFPGHNGEGPLEEITWDDWFKKLDDCGLALLYQEHTAGGEQSNFHNIISRETAEEVNSAVGGKGRSALDKCKGNGTSLTSDSRPKKLAQVGSQPKRLQRSSGNGEDRQETTGQSTATRGRASNGARASTRSRAGEKPSSKPQSGGGDRSGKARGSRTTNSSASNSQPRTRSSDASRARFGKGSGSSSRGGA